MRILGVDPGEVRVGLAMSDELGRIAMPLCTVSCGASFTETAERVKHEVSAEPISLAVVGLPLRMDGSEGEAARRARLLGQALGVALGVPVEYRDERLTSVQATRSLQEAQVRGDKQRDVVDQAAATLLLQGYLDLRPEDGPLL